MYGLTFFPGSCPPSPGFAPCAIFISSCSAFTKNSGVTPNLPEATCFIAELAISPFFSPFKCGKISDLPFLTLSIIFHL